MEGNKRLNDDVSKETVSLINEVEELFNNASAEKQWETVQAVGDDLGIELALGEDYTDLEVTDEEGNFIRLRMSETIGDHPGLKHLLNLLRIKHRFV